MIRLPPSPTLTDTLFPYPTLIRTNDRRPSTTHRVLNPDAGRASVARYSMLFFLHFRADYVIETLESCIDASHPNLYPAPITADDYLQERLREIGLKK